MDSIVAELAARAAARQKAEEDAASATTPGLQTVSDIGFGPKRVPVMEVAALPAISAGLYVGVGGTGVGKSVTAAALCHYLVGQGKAAGYLYCFEARQTRGFLQDEFASSDTGVGGKLVARGLSTFIETMREHSPDKFASAAWHDYGLTRFWASAKQNKMGVLIIDSMTMPMRAHVIDRERGRSGEPTMQQGLQPSDIDFCEKMQSWAVDNNVAVIGLVNYDLVPFADKLEGVIEGMVKVTGAGRFELRNRETRRKESVVLPKESVDWALQTFFQYADPSEESEQEYPAMAIPGYKSYYELQNNTPSTYEFGVRKPQE